MMVQILLFERVEKHLQYIQNVLRMAVTDITLDLVKASPIEPNMKPENNRAKYGRLAKIPA